MGFYIRKSVCVGPFRFNLSKAGIGASVGVKGLRIGTGPRGTYVHMGAGGIHYQYMIPKAPSERSYNRPDSSSFPTVDAGVPEGTVGEMIEIESGDVTSMVDSSSDALLQEINTKAGKASFTNILLWLAVIGIFFLYVKDFGALNIGLFAVFSIALIALSWWRDITTKVSVLMFDFEPDTEQLFEQLHETATELARCDGVWHIAAEAKVFDKKYHAGAGGLVKRNKTSISRSSPPFIKTNVQTIAIRVGVQTLHFFPDRVLVYHGKRVGAVNYSDLRAFHQHQHFVEDGSTPRDAKVVDKTWQFVNKSGGPDRRFKNNRQLPVCLYQNISFTSQNGLNELVQFSKVGPAEAFCQALAKLGEKLPV